MAYKTTWEKKGILWTFSGVVSFQEIYDATTQFFNDERSDSAMYQILDGSNIDDLLLNDDDIKHISALNKGANFSLKSLKVALISESPQVKTIYQAYIDYSEEIKISWSFAVFEDILTAEVWVNS